MPYSRTREANRKQSTIQGRKRDSELYEIEKKV